MNVNDLSSGSLKKLILIRTKIEILEAELEALVEAAEKRAPVLKRERPVVRRPAVRQPMLREVLAGLLRAAGKPLSVSELYQASLTAGYMWRSHNPINALNVKMYTDRTFVKTSPGKFELRQKE